MARVLQVAFMKTKVTFFLETYSSFILPLLQVFFSLSISYLPIFCFFAPSLSPLFLPLYSFSTDISFFQKLHWYTTVGNTTGNKSIVNGVTLPQFRGYRPQLSFFPKCSDTLNNRDLLSLQNNEDACIFFFQTEISQSRL